MLTTRRGRGALVATLEADRLSAENAEAFAREMGAVSEAEEGRVVLDLARVGFMDSTGLGALVRVAKGRGGRAPLELAAPSPAVRKVLELTRMTRIFTIHDEAGAA
jgi:anti-sigma B factor antagonist